MRLLDALSMLTALDVPVFETNDAAARLGISRAHASKLLARVAAAGHLVRLRRGVWAFADRVDRLALPMYLTAPFPSYVSLQSALYLHGMVSQVPAIMYAVSLARTERIETPLATVSVHHVDPAFFFGFEPTEGGGQLATPEKALVDFLYLSPTRSRLFRALPEVELPARFGVRAARSIVERIPSAVRRTVVSRKLDEVLAAARGRKPRAALMDRA